MAQIPFSPPQVQAALQNPVRFPDQQLQQYAQRGSPTGQVTPPMAQQEMATRGQERQAFQRQRAMSQNPENSPTIFQQKDMQIQQAMQALQQKEQQLGMMGALMARKAQDVQAREQGIATLPVREDMFTAMNGGIVFRGGGQVQRFNGLEGPSLVNIPKLLEQQEYEFYGSPKNRAEYNKVDLLRQIELLKPEDKAELLKPGMFGTTPDAYILRRRLQQMGYEVDPKTNKIKQLEVEGRSPITMQQRRALEYISKELGANPLQGTAQLPSSEQKETPASTPLPTTPKSPPTIGIASLSSGPEFNAEYEKLKPILSQKVDRTRSGELTKELINLSDELKKAVASGEMSEADAQLIMKAEMDKRSAIQNKFVEGRDARREAIRKATEGDKAELVDYLGAMAAGGPGKTLAETLSKMVPGTQKLKEDEKARKRQADKEFYLAAQADAEADKQFDLGNIEAGNKARKEAEDRKLRGAEIKASIIEARSKGIMAALNQAARGEEDESQRIGREASAATNILSTTISRDSQERIARFNADQERLREQYRYATREQNPTNRLIDMIVSSDPKQQKAAMLILGKGKDAEDLPTPVQVQLAKQIEKKYENPHDPRVIAKVEAVGELEAAKILRLKPEQAKNQPGYSDALAIVDRIQLNELMRITNRPIPYTALPSK